MHPIRIEIPKELFTPSEYKHYEEDVDTDFIKSGPNLYEFKEPLHWSVDITNTGGALLVTGTVEGEGVGVCSRCLEEASFDFTGEIEGYYIIKEDDAPPDEMEADEFDYLPSDKTIDLAPLIQAAILLEVPPMLLCDEECKGICPNCGTNLNEGECSCPVGSAPENSAENNPFAVLKDFDFGN